MSLPDLKYVSTLPRIAESPEEELESCLEQASIAGWNPLKINVFLDSSTEEEFGMLKDQLARIIAAKFKEECPAFSIISQPPMAPFKVGVEFILFRSGENVLFRRSGDVNYAVIANSGKKFLWASGLSASERKSMAKGVNLAFEKMYAVLCAEGFSFDNIVRQWNYVPQICHVEKNNGLVLQHYQMFNEIRHSYFQKYRSRHCFPAATGIGVNYGNFSLDFFACKGDQGLQDLKIESPLQKNPYQYDQSVLIGAGLATGRTKQAPEFERARIMISSERFRILVSGTASIEGEITTDKDNILEQTNATIRNIALLVSTDNLKSQYPGIILSNPQYDYLRVYVKARNDIPLVEEIVRKQFKNIPITFIQAEICRCDLLVEIEAEMSG